MSVPWFLKSRKNHECIGVWGFLTSIVIQADRVHVQKQISGEGQVDKMVHCIAQDGRLQEDRLLHVVHTETLENSF